MEERIRDGRGREAGLAKPARLFSLNAIKAEILREELMVPVWSEERTCLLMSFGGLESWRAAVAMNLIEKNGAHARALHQPFKPRLRNKQHLLQSFRVDSHNASPKGPRVALLLLFTFCQIARGRPGPARPGQAPLSVDCKQIALLQII